MDVIHQQTTYLLTNISYGTLLTCCRQSSIYTSIDASYDQLDLVRKDWIKFLFNIPSPIPYKTWVDAWLAFTLFKQHNENC